VKPEDFVVGGGYWYSVNLEELYQHIYVCTKVTKQQICFGDLRYRKNSPSDVWLLGKFTPVSSLLKELF
jgi:hypothetical protein